MDEDDPYERCWRWPLPSTRHDGRQVVKNRYVYRIIWLAVFGEPVPPVVHHTCEHEWCINPKHMEAMPSQSEHMKAHGAGGDWGQSDKTHCPKGHPYDEENTYIYVRKDGRKERWCRTCRHENYLRRKERKR